MMVTRTRSLLLAGTAVVSIAVCGGCATGESLRGGGLPADCILNRGVNDFDALDDSNLVIFGPGGRAYHVVLATPSVWIEGEYAIGIYDNDGQICPYGGDMIIVDGPIRELIPIRSIEALNDADVEALKVRFGQIEAADDAVTVTEVE